MSAEDGPGEPETDAPPRHGGHAAAGEVRSAGARGALGPRKQVRAFAEEAGDGMRAWPFLRRIEACGAAGNDLPALPALFEPGPFPIRIRTPADREAFVFDLPARAEPHDADGFRSPFRVREGMVEAVLEPEAEPLVPPAAAGGERAVTGPRLAGRR